MLVPAPTLANPLHRSSGSKTNIFTSLAQREAFRRDEETCYAAADLNETERELLRRRDWRGLIHYGAIFFVLEKLAAVIGVSNLHVYAAMRGQPLDEFLKTRNAPSALYSVGKQPTFAQPATQPNIQQEPEKA